MIKQTNIEEQDWHKFSDIEGYAKEYAETYPASIEGGLSRTTFANNTMRRLIGHMADTLREELDRRGGSVEGYQQVCDEAESMLKQACEGVDGLSHHEVAKLMYRQLSETQPLATSGSDIGRISDTTVQGAESLGVL